MCRKFLKRIFIDIVFLFLLYAFVAIQFGFR